MDRLPTATCRHCRLFKPIVDKRQAMCRGCRDYLIARFALRMGNPGQSKQQA